MTKTTLFMEILPSVLRHNAIRSIIFFYCACFSIQTPAATSSPLLLAPPEFTVETTGALETETACPHPLCEGIIPFANPNTQYWGISFDRILIPTTQNSSLFTMDGDDALIVYGETIDKISLYIHALNHHSIYDPITEKYFFPQSSIGEGFSDMHFARDVQSPFGQSFYLIITASTITYNSIKNHLIGQGIAEQNIQPYFFPARFANRGSTQFPDRLSFYTRYIYQTPRERITIAKYGRKQPTPLKATLVRGPGVEGDITDADIPTWEDLYTSGQLNQNDTEINSGLSEQLDRLERVVIGHFLNKGYHLRTGAIYRERMRHVPTLLCREPGYGSCAYDNPLGLYTGFECSPDSLPPINQVDFSKKINHCVFPLDSSDDFFVVLGVNHDLVGNSDLVTYSSWGISNATSSSREVIASADSRDFQGTIWHFSPRSNQLNPNLLYALTFSKRCGDEPNCMDIPWLDQQGGSSYQAAFIAGRHVMDRAGLHAPNPDNLIKSKFLWFRR